MAALALIATLAGTAVSAVGTIAAGQAKAQEAEAQARAQEFQAAQLDVAAKEEKASAQRDMFELRHRKELALSQLQSKAAGSGFSATDPTALQIGDEISKYGTYQEQMAMYGGEAKSRDAQFSAAAKRYSAGMSREIGSSYKTASYLSAGGTILGGIGGMAGKYASPGGFSSGGFTPYKRPGGPLVINRYG